MNRRDLLRAALAGGAALVLPDLSFAGVDPKTRRALLGEAWERAVRAGRPLLVIVVPTMQDDVYERGHEVGVALNNLDDDNLAPLAGCEPVCATLDELDRLVPGVRDAGRAWFVLVRVDQETPTWRSIVMSPPKRIVVPDLHEWVADHLYDPVWQDRLTGHAVPDTAFRAWQTEADELRRQVVLGWNVSWRASVTRALWGEGLGGDHDLPRRAEAGRKRWVAQNPPGSHWASGTACGVIYEGAQTAIYFLCGMGRVSLVESRFLALYDITER
jgi:hypothetical protein